MNRQGDVTLKYRITADTGRQPSPPEGGRDHADVQPERLWQDSSPNALRVICESFLLCLAAAAVIFACAYFNLPYHQFVAVFVGGAMGNYAGMLWLKMSRSCVRTDSEGIGGRAWGGKFRLQWRNIVCLKYRSNSLMLGTADGKDEFLLFNCPRATRDEFVRFVADRADLTPCERRFPRSAKRYVRRGRSQSESPTS
ncbi:MAG TPA: hypothetical protein VFJ58_26890 [Armatimonadota bacterium]|nr:hypothetical protein [Armatimonadota bacterium]